MEKYRQSGKTQIMSLHGDRLKKCREWCHKNKINLSEDLIKNLINLAMEARVLFADFYSNGVGLESREGQILAPTNFSNFLPDPHGLLTQLQKSSESFTPIQNGFLFMAYIVCQAKEGAVTLTSLITGKGREAVSRRFRKEICSVFNCLCFIHLRH